jgi:hypothetical protein
MIHLLQVIYFLPISKKYMKMLNVGNSAHKTPSVLN